ncbi:hypothetical protein Glove_209g134 [Diversispora epigaea]|uniref:Uncharacterized protein n=1 Tax=Diversispora epigaea TaxID=1348612 RepID=A0A397IT53_9GLOM|nr:hypothetical protein Glove_209g134 [Diversispora epigaea]
MMTTRLVPKIANFKYARMENGPTSDVKALVCYSGSLFSKKLHTKNGIKEHVLASNREKITFRKDSPDVEKTWRKSLCLPGKNDPAIRASLQNIFINLIYLADKYFTGKETAIFLPYKELDLDGSLSRAVSISDEGGFELPDMDMDEIPQIIPRYYLWEGIEVEKDRKQACELFKEAN